ncbi:MAG: hypothetical protein NTW19_18535 [Planctomycetota bacterium]|nr:hypothetical protein [Planctomycetota bacterium]
MTTQRPNHTTSAPLLFLLTLTLLPACTYETHVVNDPWQNLKQYDSNPNASKGAGDKSAADAAQARRDAIADQGFAILLDTYEGGSAERRAGQLVQRLTREQGLTDVWTKHVGKSVVVYRGQYGDPETDAARRNLLATRALQVDGLKPFEKAKLVALAQGKVAGDNGPMDLRRYNGAYTLLVGYYDQEFGKDFRKAAEKAAGVIRDGGDEGFYLHTARYSLVTVGIFPPEEIIDGQPSPQAAALQKKYPTYIANGLSVVQKLGGESLGDKPSSLYKVE